jgi:hypothetical protein
MESSVPAMKLASEDARKTAAPVTSQRRVPDYSNLPAHLVIRETDRRGDLADRFNPPAETDMFPYRQKR